MEDNYFAIITIKRPLYFLCGPDIEKSNKRKVFAKYLEDQYKNKWVRPLPIIVDKIFQSDTIKDYHLDMALLEEIVAATSYRTYIFLDSLSTAYELGMFRNSKTENNVTILVESNYKKRKNRTIGPYIEKSINSKNFIKYAFKRVGDKNLEYYEFKQDSVSKRIGAHIQKEISEYKQSPERIMLVTSEQYKSANNAIVKIDGSNVSVGFSLKSLFYIMSVFLDAKYTNYRDIVSLKDSAFKILYKEFETFMMKTILEHLGNTLDKISLHNTLSITVDLFPKTRVKEIIRHVYFFFVLMNEDSKRMLKKPTTEIFEDAQKNKKISFDLLDLFFGYSERSMAKLATAYIENPDDYVEKISYVINKKVRTIYKYRDDYKGKQLRYHHNCMLSIMDSILPTNALAFAYKENQNTLKCINVHKDSIGFLKLDIHHYFESIKYRKFYDIFKIQVYENLRKNGFDQYVFMNERYFKILIKSLFYKGSIPLGFVTSPKVSDFYLKSVDDWASKKRFIKYSRYADDILFSTNTEKISLDKTEYYFKRIIKQKGLEINQDKRIIRYFKKDGDYIKFLGICLVRQKGKNVIKISKSYIKEVIRECYSCGADKISKNDQILGKIRYIRNISYKSYIQLLRGLQGNEAMYDAVSTAIEGGMLYLPEKHQTV